MAKYQLINLEGCLMDSCGATSFIEARKYFSTKFKGRYKIICNTTTDYWEVRL